MAERTVSRRKVFRYAAGGLATAGLAAINDNLAVRAARGITNWTTDSSTGLFLPEESAGLESGLTSPNGVGVYEGKYVDIVPGIAAGDVLEYTRETKFIARKPDWSEKVLRDPMLCR